MDRAIPTWCSFTAARFCDEWAASGEEELGHLIAHVLIHEIGHHFGFSDDDMEAIEGEAKP